MALVLVTGGAGFIGSHTVDALLQRGYDVRILDSLQPRVHPAGLPDYVPKEVDVVIGDTADATTLGKALKGVSGVLHLAAYQDYLPDFSRFIHTNAESSALLFELIVRDRLPVEKILFASSQSVAGEGAYSCEQHGRVVPAPRSPEQLEGGAWEVACPQCGLPMASELIGEETCSPGTAYAISKYSIELMAAALGTRYGIPTACMRYTYVQGARNSFFNAYSGICRIFALRITNGLAPICYEDGEQRRDYVNVRDVARANVVAFEADTPGHPVFNVGGGVPMTVSAFARLMLQVLGSDLEPEVPGVFRVGDTRHTISDISRMNDLGWAPTISVEQNIREYVDWMARFRDTAEYLEEAEAVMRNLAVLRQSRVTV